ncbi:hypothetical protein Maq22A_2p41630 (plasmid) [Methylobacterium aquaticum]|uniref:DUF1403 family protein n=1 Tax=Methylobacterium aquaticum TaxID=270351 RepID=A0A0C6FBI1_9HYPH|nr:hypothetical protein Maq22A_2p41630 [Methylobacterium aquaticum]
MDQTASGTVRSARRPPRGPTAPAANILIFQPLPAWVRNGREEGGAALAAGAALLALDQVQRTAVAWLGTMRLRQALAAAGATGSLLRLREDLAAFRDAHHLTRPADNPGPAGHVHRAWRSLASQPARLDAVGLARLVGPLAPAVTHGDLLAAVGDHGSGDPVTAAATAAARLRAAKPGPDGDVLGLMLADLVLAARLGWAHPVPLLATALAQPALRARLLRRPGPRSNPDWIVACQAGYATAAAETYVRARDLAHRAEALTNAMRVVRTKGASHGLAALLADDVVAATHLAGLGSERAARRFLDRLVALGAVREHTGRATFRLYGL